MGSHLLEIVNKNIDFQKNYIEFELLDTNFSTFAKLISPNAVTLENEKEGAELSATALTELYNKQIETNTRLTAYENEIAAYAATIGKSITFERLNYTSPADFNNKIQAEETANYEVMKLFVERELDIRKRMIIIRKVLGDMALMQLIKDFNNKPNNFDTIIGGTIALWRGLLALHPSLNIGIFEKNSSTSNGMSHTVERSIVAIEFDANFNLIKKLGETHIETLPYIANDNWGDAIICNFSSLGDVLFTKGKILDFSEYGLALSPNWQGITLDTIQSR